MDASDTRYNMQFVYENSSDKPTRITLEPYLATVEIAVGSKLALAWYASNKIESCLDVIQLKSEIIIHIPSTIFEILLDDKLFQIDW